MLITGLSDLFHPSLHKKPDMCAKRCLLYSIPLADLARHVFITGLSDLFHPCLQKKPDRCKKRCLPYSKLLAELPRHAFVKGCLIYSILAFRNSQTGVKRGVWLIPCGVKKQDRQKTGSRTKE